MEARHPADAFFFKLTLFVTHLESVLMKEKGEEGHFVQIWCNVNPFRMNTCESVSKQRTLTPFRMSTYEKQGEGGAVIVN